MTSSYRGLLPLYWDQRELDRQYNARGTVPDVLPFMASYRRLTEAAQKRVACHLNIPFGGTEPERLDVYPAATSGPAPVFLFIHGGYWRALDAGDSGFMAEAMTQAGICVVAINYTLAPVASLDEIVRQCRAALAWTHANIVPYGGDPARIHIGGSSAGAHLAAMLAAPGWTAAAGLPKDVVKGMTLLSGLYDLTLIPRTHINEWMHLDAAAAERNSPLWRLPRPGTRIVGSYAPRETDEFKRQSEVYFAACHAAGCHVEVVPVPGTNHFDIPCALADAVSPLSLAVRAAMTA
ncbi:MAG TPA: alpha/beta hydrolase [Stellaceae bacterium]|nr:alpha/beta hydrolase [Stellaceae bacterium]